MPLAPSGVPAVPWCALGRAGFARFAVRFVWRCSGTASHRFVPLAPAGHSVLKPRWRLRLELRVFVSALARRPVLAPRLVFLVVLLLPGPLPEAAPVVVVGVAEIVVVGVVVVVVVVVVVEPEPEPEPEDPEDVPVPPCPLGAPAAPLVLGDFTGSGAEPGFEGLGPPELDGGWLAT